MTARGARHRSFALASVALLAAACTGTAGAVKSGGPTPPVVLVLANNDIQGLKGVPAVREFVNQVEKLSDGHLTIRVESAWEGGNDEANVVRDVAAGEADIGWAGSRVFDTLGVDSLRPLSAPYLVDSYPLEVEVVQRGRSRLLSGVKAAGVSPLALDADELRFPAAVSRPLVILDDWAGLSVRTVPSLTQEAGITALGAAPVSGGDLVNGLESGEMDAIEVAWEGFMSNHIIDMAPTSRPTLHCGHGR
jgi:TRAP-type C4-dicarboxylate transport system substrate-binding protein